VSYLLAKLPVMSATTGGLNRSHRQTFTVLRLSIFADRNRWSSRFRYFSFSVVGGGTCGGLFFCSSRHGPQGNGLPCLGHLVALMASHLDLAIGQKGGRMAGQLHPAPVIWTS
jgi:hypothetical protein